MSARGHYIISLNDQWRVATVVFPFFIMQPSLGLGIASSRTPKPTQARLKSFVTHTVFGLGLYVCALGVSYVLPVDV